MKTTTKPVPRYGLDIDGVLANFIKAIIDYANTTGLAEYFPASWEHWYNYDGPNPDKFREVYAEVSEQKDFWLNIEPLPNALTDLLHLPPPAVYITARPTPNVITQAWLFSMGFPISPVATVRNPSDKLAVAARFKLTHYVDDLPATVNEFHNAGYKAYLFTRPHNRLIEAPNRINSLAELRYELRNDAPPKANAPARDVTDTVVTAAHLEAGYKADAGKPRYDLIPFDALEEVAKVYTMGAQKYDDNNWRKGMRYGRVFAATLRHLSAFITGEDRDKESGLLHVAHAASGCLTLCSYLLSKSGTDDRYVTHPAKSTDELARSNNDVHQN